MLPPDQAAFTADLEDPTFQAGVARGWWSVVRRDGVDVTFEVTARGGRTAAVRVDFTGYPGAPPTALLWDVERDEALPVNQWPAGGRASEVFSPGWSPQNGGALYWPLDRRALPGHEAWRTQYPSHVWSEEWTVTRWLHELRDVVRSATTPVMQLLEAGR